MENPLRNKINILANQIPHWLGYKKEKSIVFTDEYVILIQNQKSINSLRIDIYIICYSQNFSLFLLELGNSKFQNI